MLGGIETPWKFPMSYYFTDGCLNAETLKCLILENVEAAFKAAFKVRTVAYDQASINRAALDSLRANKDGKNQDKIEEENEEKKIQRKYKKKIRKKETIKIRKKKKRQM